MLEYKTWIFLTLFINMLMSDKCCHLQFGSAIQRVNALQEEFASMPINYAGLFNVYYDVLE